MYNTTKNKRRRGMDKKNVNTKTSSERIDIRYCIPPSYSIKERA